ncbi:MAG TPA: glycoside hydrolase family 3 N-terminal domain-containing protein, partial [Sphaerochaeta sp.]|nr:glycoside hydrolase family 3 N-terminal domain-containing protein [Sphaerochaeta sp.]
MKSKQTVGKNREAWEAHKAKAKELVAQMTLEECASQLLFTSVAIERLGIPEYNWWNEALHGVARAGMATVFPQPIGLAATFNPTLIKRVAEVIADEGRAKYNAANAEGDRGIYKGITFWSPNINIFRDPRWGRGQETYGEDPYLTSELGVAFVEGIQQQEGPFFKATACAKHYAVHSGPESQRHSLNAIANEKDMAETYLPAFKALVDAGVAGVMGAYNRTNDEPCCGSKTLLQSILNEQWGFDGYITSDCWAIADFHLHHGITKNENESIALALENGCVLNCGNIYSKMMDAHAAGLVSEKQIRDAAEKVVAIRASLGMFEEHTLFDDIPYATVDCIEHRELNEEVARKSLVLLSNDGLLPLDSAAVKQIAVVGPNANSIRALEGNYHGTSNQYHTVLEAIRTAFPDAYVTYSTGAHLYQEQLADPGSAGDRLSEVRTHMNSADVTIVVVGLDETLESEDKEGDTSGLTGDKRDLLLPESQRLLIADVMAQNKPVVLVNMSGSAIDLVEGNNANAVIQAWYPG